MPKQSPSSSRPPTGSLAIIALVIAGAAGAFAYTAGWLSPTRLTPTKIVDSLAPPGGPSLGYRRNHAKGICFTGVFQSNGDGAELSSAQVFARGEYPALGRFNLATADAHAPDATVRVRGVGLQLSTPDGEVWRSAMIDAPVFPVSTPERFYELQLAAGSKDPNAMKAFVAGHPEFAPFAEWAKTAPWTASYADEPYNGLNSFIFVNGSGAERVVRWSLRPQARPAPIAQEDLAKLGPDHLAREIAERVAKAPQRWTMVVTVADASDPTADPSKAWPAGRRAVEVGVLVMQRIEGERNGPCREINFDPTILPHGVRPSDDPFPAARSAAYARSYDLRTSELKYFPHQSEAGEGGER
ncbi:MAG TPA: catalase family peroxidase [Methylocystis sp.]|nr:catalase family peroxidase [Methylocystis sp.]